MLGLAEKIGGAELAVHGLVGDYQSLGGPRQQVDPDAAEELALGLRHECVAGADQHVDRCDAAGAERHGAHRLDAAQHVDLVGAREMLRRDDGGRGSALEGRRAGRDARNACHLRRHHRHVGRREQRVLTARHVAADRIDRDVLVAQHHARQSLDLDVLKRVALDLREVPNLLLCEQDIVPVLPGECAEAGLDLVLAEPKVLALPAIELDRHLAHGGVAPARDIVQRVFHDAADLRVRLRGLGIADAGLQVSRHRNSCFLLRTSGCETARAAG